MVHSNGSFKKDSTSTFSSSRSDEQPDWVNNNRVPKMSLGSRRIIQAGNNNNQQLLPYRKVTFNNNKTHTNTTPPNIRRMAQMTNTYTQSQSFDGFDSGAIPVVECECDDDDDYEYDEVVECATDEETTRLYGYVMSNSAKLRRHHRQLQQSSSNSNSNSNSGKSNSIQMSTSESNSVGLL